MTSFVLAIEDADVESERRTGIRENERPELERERNILIGLEGANLNNKRRRLSSKCSQQNMPLWMMSYDGGYSYYLQGSSELSELDKDITTTP